VVSTPPSGRHARGGERADDGWDLARALEIVAAGYGWGPDYVDYTLTDEQLIAYLDAYQDRVTARRDSEFTGWVEAVRIGTIFAHDARQHRAWRAKGPRSAGRQRGLTGAALEAAVARVAEMFPANVVRGPA
jgi:hypothetical protein